MAYERASYPSNKTPQRLETAMTGKAVISLTTGLEDAEKVTVAFLVAVGAVEQGRSYLMFLTKEAVRLALTGYATATACDGCPPLQTLLQRYTAAAGRYLVCPICFDARKLNSDDLIDGAETCTVALGGMAYGKLSVRSLVPGAVTARPEFVS
jgi:predicted peroxiredoxin